MYEAVRVGDDRQGGGALERTPSIRDHLMGVFVPNAPVFGQQFADLQGAQQAIVRSFSLRLDAVENERIMCVCCLDVKAVDQGLLCGNHHFLCRDDCLSSYVHALCDEPYKLRQQGGELCCPAPDCDAAHFTVAAVIAGLVGHDTAAREYSDFLSSLPEAGGAAGAGGADVEMARVGKGASAAADAKRIQSAVVDALSFRCPSARCKVVLDPNPEGCCSMHCSSCGAYFCWLCFKLSGGSADESHAHVLQCRENPSRGSLFVVEAALRPVHKRRHIEFINLGLLTLLGNAWRRDAVAMRAVETLEHTVLRDFRITAADVFHSNEAAISSASPRALRDDAAPGEQAQRRPSNGSRPRGGGTQAWTRLARRPRGLVGQGLGCAG